MRYEESCAIKSILSDYQLRTGHPFAHVINLGSGDVDKLKKISRGFLIMYFYR